MAVTVPRGSRLADESVTLPNTKGSAGIPSRWVRFWFPFHLFCLGVWLLPAQSQISRTILPVIRPYMNTFGLHQAWSMFAPNPYSLDVWVRGVVHYQDGTSRDWWFPRLEGTSYWHRYQNERWRKALENANQVRYKALWPYMAEYVANRCQGPSRVKSVDLYRVWDQVPPPGKKSTGVHSFKFYSRGFDEN